MREKIICRFSCQEDIDLFNDMNKSLLREPIDKDVLEYDFREPRVKRRLRPKQTSETTTHDYLFEAWHDMPEFNSKKIEPYAKVDFFFNEEDLELAQQVFNQNITHKTKSAWFPKLAKAEYISKRVIGGNVNNKYPIYVVSKNRANYCSTSIHLSQIEVEHYIVVEPDQLQLYQNSENLDFNYARLLVMDMKFYEDYDTCDDLGDTKSKGPGAARNFSWQHSIDQGFDYHWVMDDNADEGFHYLYENEKIKLRTGAFLRACEDFTERYSNVAQAGLNYTKFALMSEKYPPFNTNTRCYSFILLKNDIPYRWRGRYNEDTDLSLRILKDGLCTIQFNAFLAGKATTQKIKGGNTEEFYAGEGTLPKSQMLEDLHPDVAKVVWKFSRWHHEVDYSGYTQELELDPNVNIGQNKINNYGMKVIQTKETKTNDTREYLESKYRDARVLNDKTKVRVRRGVFNWN